jgi:hypothetical protein
LKINDETQLMIDNWQAGTKVMATAATPLI